MHSYSYKNKKQFTKVSTEWIKFILLKNYVCIDKFYFCKKYYWNPYFEHFFMLHEELFSYKTLAVFAWSRNFTAISKI